MAIKKYEEMNALELDILKEIGSIGGGNAATALSSMMNAKVMMSLPRAEILEFNEAIEKMIFFSGCSEKQGQSSWNWRKLILPS